MLATDDDKVVYLSNTCEGKRHDKKLCDEQKLEFQDGIEILQDSGFIGYEPENVSVTMPIKKRKKVELTDEQKEYNKKVASVRVKIEHVIGGIKRLEIVGRKLRCKKGRFRDVVMMIACGLHNFRTDFRAKK